MRRRGPRGGALVWLTRCVRVVRRSIKLKLLKYGGMLSQAHSVMVPNEVQQVLIFPLHLTEAGMFYYTKPGRDQSQTKHRVFPRVVWALYKWLSQNSPPCASRRWTEHCTNVLDVPN